MFQHIHIKKKKHKCYILPPPWNIYTAGYSKKKKGEKIDKKENKKTPRLLYAAVIRKKDKGQKKDWGLTRLLSEGRRQ